MKKYFILSIVSMLICISCNKKEYKSTDFVLQNNCNFSIEVHTSGMVRSEINGWIERSFIDVVPSGGMLLLRTLEVTEDIKISQVFTNLEIFRGNTKSGFDVMNKANWRKSTSSKGKPLYTLVVNEDFFR